MLDVDARRDPTETEKQRRDRQQPPQFEIHDARRVRAYRPSIGGSGVAPTCLAWSRRTLLSCRFSRTVRNAPTSRPAVTPTANTTSSRRISGTSQETHV